MRSRSRWTPQETGPELGPTTFDDWFRPLRPSRRQPVFLATRSLAALFLGVFLVVMLLVPLLAVPPAIGRSFEYAADRIPVPEPHILPDSTLIYDRKGRLITRLHGDVDRTPVPLVQMPKHLRDAVIAVEDKDFYEHDGVDLASILRAAYVNVKARRIAQGGSTITQQFVKNLYTDKERSFARKLREALLAKKISERMTKDEILESYLNSVYFGQGAYGVHAAARTYFSVPAKKLSVPQAAMLAGLIAAPERFDPVDFPKVALERRNYVLDRMVEEGYLGPKKAKAISEKPLALKRPEDRSRAPYFSDHVRRYLQRHYGVEETFGGGLRVTTSLDLDWQRAAESAVWGHLTDPKGPAAALVAIDPATGRIRAMVGGRNFQKRKFNLATQARRQTGSAFKTFTLTAALEKGINPRSVWQGPSSMIIKDERCETDGEPWEVSNYSDQAAGTMDLLRATAGSVNTIFAQLVTEVGPDRVADVAGRMGIRSPLGPFCSITLGSEAVTPAEMTRAYATLAARGMRRLSGPVHVVKRLNGQVLDEPKPKATQAISTNVADAVTLALRGVVTGGTASSAYFGRPAAGKTGTAQNHQDAWFCGFVPQLATCVWMGYPKAEIPMRGIYGLGGVTGGSLPAAIWRDFMSTVTAGMAVRDFHAPNLSEFDETPKRAKAAIVRGGGGPSGGGSGGGGGRRVSSPPASGGSVGPPAEQPRERPGRRRKRRG